MSLTEKFDANRREFAADSRRRIEEAAHIYKQSLVETLGDQGDREHPSRPGESPHKVTGNLQASVIERVDEGALAAEVGTTAPYGKYLIGKRPYLQIAFEKVSARIRQTLLDR